MASAAFRAGARLAVLRGRCSARRVRSSCGCAETPSPARTSARPPSPVGCSGRRSLGAGPSPRLRTGAVRADGAIQIPRRWEFERLKVVPQEVRRELCDLVLGSHDPELQVAVCWAPVKVFDLYHRPSGCGGDARADGSGLSQGRGRWRREHMPRTVMVFLNEPGLTADGGGLPPSRMTRPEGLLDGAAGNGGRRHPRRCGRERSHRRRRDRGGAARGAIPPGGSPDAVVRLLQPLRSGDLEHARLHGESGTAARQRR